MLIYPSCLCLPRIFNVSPMLKGPRCGRFLGPTPERVFFSSSQRRLVPKSEFQACETLSPTPKALLQRSHDPLKVAFTIATANGNLVLDMITTCGDQILFFIVLISVLHPLIPE